MVRPKAVYVRDVGRLSIDSELQVIMREKARFTEALGWSYRFKSGEEWILLPLDRAALFVYDDRPEASIDGNEKRSTPAKGAHLPERMNLDRARGPAAAATYIDDL